MALGIATLVTGVVSLVGTWLETKKVKAEGNIKIEQTKTEARTKAIQTAAEQDGRWDELMAEGSQESWKDEFWTVFLALPLVLLFWPDPEIQQIAKDGFENLDSAPEWYVGAVMLAIASAFGYRKFVQPFLKTKGR